MNGVYLLSSGLVCRKPPGKAMTVLLSVLLLVFCAAAQAELPANSEKLPHHELSQSDRETKICFLTDAALVAEMDLERFYLQYLLAGSKEPALRRWRYFLGQAASATSYAASDITNVVAFSRSFEKPVSNTVFRRSYQAGLVGSIIPAVGDGYEIFSNSLLACKNLAAGANPHEAAVKVRNSLSAIDDLLAEREKMLVELEPGSLKEINTLEGRVLKLHRDWCAYEFADIYANIKSYQSSNNLTYALDAAAFSLYAVAYQLQLKGISRPGVAGAAAVVSVVGGGFFGGNTATTALAAKLLYSRHFHKFAQMLGENVHNTRAEASKQLASLEALSTNCPEISLHQLGHLSQRLLVYRLWSQRFEEYLDKQTQHLRRMSKVALQNQVSGPLIAGAYLAQNTTDIVNYQRFRSDPRRSQRLSAAGCVSGVAGTGVSCLVTYQGFIQDLFYLHRLKKKKSLSEDLVHKRIATLDDLESLLRREL